MSNSVAGRNPITGKWIRIFTEDGRIASIREAAAEDDTWLSPGFIDLQVNGYAGFDVNSDTPTAETIISLTRALIATGITTYLPTVITASEEKIIPCLRAIAEARRIDPVSAHCIPYAHVEGPHISSDDGYRGAHPLEEIRPPSLGEFERWQAASGNIVGMVTISPHYEESVSYISALARKKIHVALGHTNATPAQIHAAVDAGAALSTHLGNGIAQMLPRHPNPIWEQLAEDRLTATFIGDGHHLSPDTMKAMLRAKGYERSVLVSDVVALGGMPPGSYNAPVGGTVELRPDGRLELSGTPFLAGASLVFKDTIPRVITLAKIPVPAVFKMATENPGRFVGHRGRFVEGAAADTVRFRWAPSDPQLQIGSITVQGQEFNP